MGNACTCINEENKDKDEFKSVQEKKAYRDADVIKI